MRKSSKGLSSRTTCHVNLRISCCNSPGIALHVGVSGMALRPPVPEELEITDTHTRKDTQNTAINIIVLVHVRDCIRVTFPCKSAYVELVSMVANYNLLARVEGSLAWSKGWPRTKVNDNAIKLSLVYPYQVGYFGLYWQTKSRVKWPLFSNLLTYDHNGFLHIALPVL